MGRTLITPPEPVMLASVPSGSVPTTLLIASASAVALLVEESVAVITAATPLAICVAFIPLARHVIDPVPDIQDNVFPADVNTGPAAALTETTSVAEYESVH